MAAKKANASDVVFDFMREKLISGEWKAGMKITTELALVHETGVSRASVREAIDKLVAMGILIRRQGAGTFVCDTSPTSFLQDLLPNLVYNSYDIVEFLDFRELIEPACVRRFALMQDLSKIKKLNDCCETMARHVDCKDSQEFAQADWEFHFTIISGSNNEIVKKIVDIVADILKFYQQELCRSNGPSTGVQEHLRILEAIQTGDGELAALLTQRHIQRSKRDYLSQHPDLQAQEKTEITV